VIITEQQKVTILVEDIPLCLKYNIKMKLNMYSVWHDYVLLFVLLATSFSLKRPTPGEYLQKNFKMPVRVV
jgi:hypothetical protein